MSKAPAVDYALQIIEYFAVQSKDIGIADISNAIGINKNAVSRVLEALMEQNWIFLSDEAQKKYRLTMRPFSLINRHWENYEIVRIAAHSVEKLNHALGDSTYLGIKSEDAVLYAIHCNSTKTVRINGCTGGEYPLNCAAPGKILLSYCSNEEIEAYFNSKREKKTSNTIIDFDTFMKQANEIKKQGYAVDNEEFAKGIICIAVPVFDCRGDVTAAIGISSLTLYDSISSLVEEKLPVIQKTASEISANLGYK